MPLVTIFTPVFNRAHTLHRAYESLKSQTFKNFEWIIINDGSTDNTDEVVENYINDNILNIRYYKQENQHKFLTLKRAIDLAQGDYFTILDSDDALLPSSLTDLISHIDKNSDIIHINGLAIDDTGNLYGKQFPQSPLDCSVFDLKYKYLCKGENWGIGHIDAYRKIDFSIDKYKNKGFIPEGRFFYFFDKIGKHRFINKPVRIYFRDLDDNDSLANNFYQDKNAFGLAETYKAFIEVYHHQWLNYPKVLFRNLMGYLIFSAKDNRPYINTIREIYGFFPKILGAIFYILKPILRKINIK